MMLWIMLMRLDAYTACRYFAYLGYDGNLSDCVSAASSYRLPVDSVSLKSSSILAYVVGPPGCGKVMKSLVKRFSSTHMSHSRSDVLAGCTSRKSSKSLHGFCCQENYWKEQASYCKKMPKCFEYTMYSY